jgi:hypothetical protein
MGEEGVGLEHHADIALLNGAMRDILTINKNLPSEVFPALPPDAAPWFCHSLMGRVTSPSPLRDGKINVVDNRVVTKSLGDIAQFNEMFLCHGRAPLRLVFSFGTGDTRLTDQPVKDEDDGEHHHNKD